MKKFNIVIRILISGFISFLGISYIYAETGDQNAKILWEKELTCERNSSCNLRGATLNEENNNLLILGASVSSEPTSGGKLWFSEIDTDNGEEATRIILKDISSAIAKSIQYTISDTPIIHKNGDIFAIDRFDSSNNMQSILRTNLEGKDFIIIPVDKETFMTSHQKRLSNRGINVLIKKMILLSDGNFLLVGRGQSDNALAMKVDPQGNRIWEKEYDMGRVDIFQDAVPGNDEGHFFIAGVSTDTKGKFPDSNSASVYILKCDAKGNILQRKTMPGNPWPGRSPKMCKLNLDEIIMVYDKSDNMKSVEYKIKAFDSNLQLLWEKQGYKFKQDNLLKSFHHVSDIPNGGFAVAFCASENDAEIYYYDNAGNKLKSISISDSFWLGKFDMVCEEGKVFIVSQTGPDKDRVSKIKIIALELKQ